ncbi:MAG: hypothetical protein QXO51_07495 [Halobacteria archaeon]
MNLVKDDSARVPFSAIGALLLSAAIVTTALLVKLDAQIARETAREPEISESAELLASAKQDVARLLSWSVQGAASGVSRAPVVAGFRGTIPNNQTPERCAENQTCVSLFNEERVRREALRRLGGYLAASNATYRQGESRVEAHLPENWTNLTLEPVNMDIARTLNPPLWGPRGDAEAYWLARLPVNFTVTKPRQKTHRETAPVETFVPARFPLVRNLTEGFARERLRGGPVFWEFTGGSLGQVWVKGYLQWAGKGTGDLNDVYGAGGIRPNEDVEKLLNGVLLLDEGFQFQTVDPGSLRAVLPLEFQTALDEVEQVGGGLVQAGKTLEELLAGDGSGRAREQMREPRSADEFLVCPLESPKADIPAGSSNSCKTTPEDDGACGLCRSGEIRSKVKEIASQVYSAEIRADLSRQTGTTGPCPGASGWRYTGHSCSAAAAPSGALGADVCAVTYTRTCAESKDGETTTYSRSRSDAVNVRFVASDYSRTNLDLSAAGLPGSGSTGRDVAGAFSSATFDKKTDPNLADAMSEYRSKHWRFEDQRGVLSDPGSSSVPGKTVATEKPGWLEDEAKEEVRRLIDRFKEIKTWPGTTPENRTHYADYLKKVSEELVKGMTEKAPGLAERSRFADDGTYRSAAAKALYLARAWFVDDAVRRIHDFGEKGVAEINARIDDLLKGARGGKEDRETRESAREAIRKRGEFLKGAASFPLGMEMNLSVGDRTAEARGWARGWNETVRLSIDQRPDWLNGNETEGFIPLKIRTWSLPVPVAPTRHGGAMILPPPFPWVVTANAWVVHVEGEFALTAEDAGESVWTGEGFERVGWVREFTPEIKDPLTGKVLGDNRRMRFDFWTVLPIVVPPGPGGVGDVAGGEPLSCSPPEAC